VNLDESLNRVLSRYDELQELVASHPNPGSAEHTAMLKEYSDLTPVVQGIEDKSDGRRQITHDVTIEIEGESKPALVAEWITMVWM